MNQPDLLRLDSYNQGSDLEIIVELGTAMTNYWIIVVLASELEASRDLRFIEPNFAHLASEGQNNRAIHLQ